MDSGLTNEMLYVAVRLIVTFENGNSADSVTKTGTGFFVGEPRGKRMWIVTNRHMIDIAYANPKFVSLKLRPARIEAQFRTRTPATGLPDIRVHGLLTDYSIKPAPDPANDVALIGDFRIELLPGESNAPPNVVIEYFIPITLLATRGHFAAERFAIGDMVGFAGYPEWYDAQNLRPILRTGTIASDPRYSYSHGEARGECLAYEAFSYSGSSGSPVLTFKKNVMVVPSPPSDGDPAILLIGINAGHLKVGSDQGHYQTHSGISYLFKSTVIRDLLGLSDP